jgi:hypothetical protein
MGMGYTSMRIFMINFITLADLSNEPVMKFDQSDDFDSDEIFF